MCVHKKKGEYEIYLKKQATGCMRNEMCCLQKEIADDDDIFPDGNREKERVREQTSVCL